MNYLQQGDVLMKLTDSIPTNANKIESDLIHKGQNHHHRIKGAFNIYNLNSEIFIECVTECDITHEEHKTITLPIGFYKKGIVLEYDHFLNESREVID